MEKNLLCYCDHCLNSTCSTQSGVCYAKFSLNNDKLELESNCFQSNESLIQNLICDDQLASTRQSQSITRCCNSTNYCNQKDGFLPPADKVKEILMALRDSPLQELRFPKDQQTGALGTQPSIYPWPEASHSNQYEESSLNLIEKYTKYSSKSLESKIMTLSLLSVGFFFILMLALTVVYKRRRRRRRSTPPITNWISAIGHVGAKSSISRDRLRGAHKGGVAGGQGGVDSASGAGGSNSSGDGTSLDSGSSNTAKLILDVAVFDSNSVESHEPLIKSANQILNQHHHHYQQKQQRSSKHQNNSSLHKAIINMSTSSTSGSESATTTSTTSTSTNTTESHDSSAHNVVNSSPSDDTIDLDRKGSSGFRFAPAFLANALKHPHRLKVPWMSSEINSKGKLSAHIQMATGADILPNKPETSSGSGNDQNYLAKRSISRDIELLEVVGTGFFGVVWRGDYKGTPVAVKIFSTKAEQSWARETELYTTTLLRHKNILGYIAADKRYEATMASYWLVTDYYPMGSLYDFLRRKSMSMGDAVRMAYSIANGLCHLHIEILGTQGKPAMAHRDLKSKNILVKADGTCCIADLGMAIRYSSLDGVVDVPANSRVGTRRYLAPELLEDKLNLMDFESVKATDMYSFGLVLWEILRRTCYVLPQNSSSRFPSTHSSNSPTKGSYSYQFKTPVRNDSPSSKNRPKDFNSRKPGAPHSAPTDSPPSLSLLQFESFKNDEQQAKSPADSIDASAPTKVSSAPDTEEAKIEALSRQPLIEKQHQQRQQQQPEQLQQQQKTSNPSSGHSASGECNSDEVSIDDMENEAASICDTYEPPYSEFVSSDPKIDEMREIVCLRRLRPPISERWTKFAPMRSYSTLMRECWYDKPQARLSALRVRKTLAEIAMHFYGINVNLE